MRARRGVRLIVTLGVTTTRRSIFFVVDLYQPLNATVIWRMNNQLKFKISAILSEVTRITSMHIFWRYFGGIWSTILHSPQFEDAGASNEAHRNPSVSDLAHVAQWTTAMKDLILSLKDHIHIRIYIYIYIRSTSWFLSAMSCEDGCHICSYRWKNWKRSVKHWPPCKPSQRLGSQGGCLTARWKIATEDVPQITKFWHQKKASRFNSSTQHHQHNELSETIFSIHWALHPGHGWPQCPIQALKTSSCSAIGKGGSNFFSPKLRCQL